MKLEMPTKVFAVFLLAAGLISAEGSASAQTDDASSQVDAVGAEAVSDAGGEGVAAVPLEMPLGESDLVGSVLHKRTVWFERFDTDHDIDDSDDEDREIFGSHYVWEDTFRVRIPASLDDKPEDVFGFAFSVVLGGAVFSARAVGGVLV